MHGTCVALRFALADVYAEHRRRNEDGEGPNGGIESVLVWGNAEPFFVDATRTPVCTESFLVWHTSDEFMPRPCFLWEPWAGKKNGV